MDGMDHMDHMEHMAHTEQLRQLQRLAREQHDVLGIDDGRAFGLPPRRLRAWGRRNGWVAVHDQVLLAPWARPGAFGTRAWIARSAVHNPAALFGASALHALGVRSTPPSTIHLVVGHNRTVPVLDDPGIVLHRSRSLRPADVVVRSGLATTTPARTIADLAAVRPLTALRADVLACMQRGQLRREELITYLGQHPRFAGRPTLRTIVEELRDQQADSSFEWACRRLLRDYGLRPYPAPFPWQSHSGRVLHLDVAFPTQWLHLDVIGEQYHGPDVAQKDRARWNALDQGGWRTVWVDARAMRNPRALVADVRARLAEADPHRQPARRADCGCRTCAWTPPG